MCWDRGLVRKLSNLRVVFGWTGEQNATRAVQSAIEESMTEQLVVRIRYTAGDGQKTKRDVEPVIFASRSGRWDLIGWCRLRDEMRWFHMARVEHARVTKVPCAGHTVEEIGTPPATSRSVGTAG